MAEAARSKAEKRGRRAETLATWLLRLKFYRILGHRVRTPLGEIDLIARAPSGVVCFIEVKARAGEGDAAEALARANAPASLARRSSIWQAAPAWRPRARASTS